jgi:hypothetical protein
MSAFLLPLRYLTFKVGEVLSVVVLLRYSLPTVLRVGGYKRPRWLRSEISSFGKIEYSSGKARLNPLPAARICFFTCNIRLSKRPYATHAQHLVHCGQLVLDDHNIYPARKVSLL